MKNRNWDLITRKGEIAWCVAIAIVGMTLTGLCYIIPNIILLCKITAWCGPLVEGSLALAVVGTAQIAIPIMYSPWGVKHGLVREETKD